jgi:hypothetical protein
MLHLLKIIQKCTFDTFIRRWNLSKHLSYVQFQVLMAASTNIVVFRVVALCSLREVYWYFRGARCLHHEALIMVAARTSETLVHFYRTTWHNNPEDSHLHLSYHNITFAFRMQWLKSGGMTQSNLSGNKYIIRILEFLDFIQCQVFFKLLLSKVQWSRLALSNKHHRTDAPASHLRMRTDQVPKMLCSLMT